MAKKKRHQLAQGFGTDSGAFAAALVKAKAYWQRQEWSEAKAKLQELEQRYPNHPKLLAALLDFYYQTKDFQNYQDAAERLVKVEPRNANALLELGTAYLKNTRPLLALETFRRFLEQFPNHQMADETRETVAEFEAKLPEILQELPLEGENVAEIALLHEQVLCKLEQGKYEESRQIAEKLLAICPKFAPALNNISLAYEREGQLDAAIATAQRVLEIDSDNFHAHANLTRFYILSGEETAARQQAEQITAKDPKILDFWAKKAEALAYIEDYQGIVDIFTAAEQVEPLDSLSPLLLHLAAVANMNLGQEKAARKLWKETLQHSPGFTLAQKNLDDLKHLPGKRHAPWAFDLEHWVSRKIVDDLLDIMDSGKMQKLSDEECGQRYLEKHPEMNYLVPILLRQGGPLAREFALRLARMAKTPELLAALRDFTLSDKGLDQMRLEASQVVMEAGLIPSGTVRFWSQGQWRDVLLMGMEINDEPSVNHPKAVRDLQSRAITALKAEQGEEAEALLLQALELAPDAPDLNYNLAGAYQIQERVPEMEALIQQIYAKYPDYPFARIALARMHIQKKELGAAEELLKPMLQCPQFNFQAFCRFCEVQIELCLAQKKPEGIHSWLKMWESVESDDPRLSYWKKLLNLEKFLDLDALSINI